MPTSAAVSRPHSARESFAASVRAQEWIIKKRGKQGQKSCCNHPVLMNVQCCDDSPEIQGGEDSRWGDEKPFQQPCCGTTCQSMKRQSWRQGLALWGFCGILDRLSGGAWMLFLLLLTALWHGGGSWEIDEQGPVAEGGGCGSRGRAGDHSVDNSGVPLHHLTGGHSPDRTTDRRMSTHRLTQNNRLQINVDVESTNTV